MATVIQNAQQVTSHMRAANIEDIQLVEKAYAFAKDAHKEQKRYSGEPYFTHLFAVAEYLAQIGMDAHSIAAGFLHDSIEDVDVAPETIEAEFGTDVLNLVEGVTKLRAVRYHGVERHAESLRKLFAATAQDVRVIIIKLADRLHNATTLEYVPPKKRKRIAIETLEIFAPIADRLGMGIMRRDLEDAAFPHAYPREHQKVRSLLKERHSQATKRLEKLRKALRTELATHDIKNFRTESRIKGLYSLYKKLERKEWDVYSITDILALRVIVPTIADCYTVLGIIHGRWTPLPGKLKDYIANEKPNGYKSIHTTIHTGEGGSLEIQVRTEKMHAEAQFGIASHLSYKETGGDTQTKIGSGLSWIKQFFPARFTYGNGFGKTPPANPRSPRFSQTAPEWIKTIAATREHTAPEELIDEFKEDFFTHRVFVFTPEGDVIDLPLAATPVDFAYAIHSDIGNHIAGAKVNEKMVSLDTILKNGDMVEIITKKSAHPTQKWLQYAKTSLAKRHIRAALQQ